MCPAVVFPLLGAAELVLVVRIMLRRVLASAKITLFVHFRY